MRLFFYWLIRAGAAAAMLALTLLLWVAACQQLVFNTMNVPDWSSQLASMSYDDVSLGMMNLIWFGLAGGIFSGVAALVGWLTSRGFARRWTAVVPTGEGDAVIHPAVIHLQALSPEERQQWVAMHPSHSQYISILAIIQVLFGALLYWFFWQVGSIDGSEFRDEGTSPVNLGAIALAGYVIGLCVFEGIRFGGWISRRVRRWVGMPAEVLAQNAFQRDARVRD